MKPHKSKLKAIDFFCGAGGMTNGFKKAGIDVIAGIDFDEDCKETYEYNNKGVKFILADIKKLSFSIFEKETKVRKNDDNLIFIGCSPCQYWTKIKTNKTKSEESKNLLIDFQKFVNYYNPGYVVIENVPGIYTKKSESPLNDFLKFLKKKGYYYENSYGIINASHYGVPQTRRRFLLIASRVNKNISMPIPYTKENPPTVKRFIGDKSVFPPIEHGHKDSTDFIHTVSDLSINNQKRLKVTPHNGGSRLSWKDSDLQIPAYKNKDKSFQDIYGRMRWDKPAPTITTKFYSISNGRFAHPEQNRAISLREGATIQTFDSTYLFFTNSIAKTAKLIGNAVPPNLSYLIASTLKD